MVIKPTINRIITTLNKVYLDKNISIKNTLNNTQTIPISEDDALELFGNLLENAFKWCSSTVVISITSHNSKSLICIEDNGSGIAAESRQKILERGFRADSATPGHGIGLAIVQDILAMYDSELEISQSELGGAKICFTLSS